MSEEKGKIIDVEKVHEGIRELCTEQGVQVSGNGIIIKLLTEIKELLDKQNLKLHYIEKRLQEIKDQKVL